MQLKIIGIGNILMSDDGIGVYITQKLKSDIEKNRYFIPTDNCLSGEKLPLIEYGGRTFLNVVKVIAGETDFEYCLDNISETDAIIIIDAINIGDEIGTVTLYDLEDKKNNLEKSYRFSQHGISFISLLKNKFVKIITIEGYCFEMGYGLSNELKNKLKKVEEEVYSKIYEIMNG